MSTTITGIVTNGVIVPSSPLPEGAKVEVTIVSAAATSRRLSMLEFLVARFSLPTMAASAASGICRL